MSNDKLQTQLIASLQNEALFPHTVTAIQLIETHISWIILTGAYAYKIKKSVNFGFLDFSTLERRKFFCEEELRLNRRFSRNLYQEVIAIRGSESKPQLNGEGDIIEYAVKMKQFPQQCLLKDFAEADKLTSQQIDILAYKLATFHEQAGRANVQMPAYGSVEAIYKPVMENFSQLRPLLREKEDIQQLNVLQEWTEKEFSRLIAVFADRREQGFIRECHGDLHLGNIVVIDDEITFFDCIEFNEQLRWIDTFSELAFLLMDFESQSHVKWANRLLNKYLEYCGDYAGLGLLAFYKVYRALVRAKVNALRLSHADLDKKEIENIRAELGHYLTLAQSYGQPKKTFLAITHGISGTGKSTLSRLIAANTGAIHIRSDVERKRLSGLKPEEKSHSKLSTGIYTESISKQTYHKLGEIAEMVLGEGYPIIVDATFLSVDERNYFRAIAVDQRVPFVIIDCQAAIETITQRLQKRSQLSGEASEADIAVMQKQQESQDFLADEEKVYTFAVNTEDEFQWQKFYRFINS